VLEVVKALHLTGKLDETEGTTLGAEIEILLCAATIEEQLHILKDVSKFSSTVILKCSVSKEKRLLKIVIRYYATRRKVTGSRSDEVNFVNVPNPSGCIRPWGSLSL
jgi:hypothetical protein